MDMPPEPGAFFFPAVGFMVLGIDVLSLSYGFQYDYIDEWLPELLENSVEACSNL